MAQVKKTPAKKEESSSDEEEPKTEAKATNDKTKGKKGENIFENVMNV